MSRVATCAASDHSDIAVQSFSNGVGYVVTVDEDVGEMRF